MAKLPTSLFDLPSLVEFLVAAEVLATVAELNGCWEVATVVIDSGLFMVCGVDGSHAAAASKKSLPAGLSKDAHETLVPPAEPDITCV